MDKLAPMDTIGGSFRPWLSCEGICWLNRHQTGDTDSVQPVILLPVQRDSQETFIPCEARMLWYSAERTSSQQLRDTTKTRYNASFTTYMRGLCHGISSRFLPARADRPGVGVPDALWAVAIGACCSSPHDTQAAAAPGPALQKASALSGSHPSTLLCCL